MTEQTTTLTTHDPRLRFAKAVALGGAVIRHVSPDQLTAPTPCDEFDVRQLTGHLVAVLQRVAAVGRSEDPMSTPFILEGVPDDRWGEAWTEAAHTVQDAWSDDSVLDRELQLPWTTMRGRDVLAIYTSEITVHTWDLATATGQRPEWDDEVVGLCLTTLRRQLPAEGRGAELPFAEVVPTADDAPLIDQLVAWSGRRP